MKKTARFLVLALTCLGLCQCLSRKQATGGWSPNPARSGRPLLEGARLGWHAPLDDDER